MSPSRFSRGYDEAAALLHPPAPSAERMRDAQVAHELFGWRWALDETVVHDGGRERRSGRYRVILDPALWPDEVLLGEPAGDEPARVDRPYNGQTPPHFSTDVADAWRIVNRLRDEHDLALLLEQVRYLETGDDDDLGELWRAEPGQWLAHFQSVAVTYGTGVGATAPEAIVAAALDAKATLRTHPNTRPTSSRPSHA